MTTPSALIERQALDLLEAASEQPRDSQRHFIDTHGDYDRAVRARAASLLDVQQSGEGSIRTGGAAEYDAQEAPPDQLGAYKIGERLGRGGMGTVYLARRTGGDFDHLAAVKFIKTGLLSDSLIERFRRERQLLANLRHPNIAQLYDGGETPDGAPYFVMEYVDGLPLPKWLELEAPDQAPLLALFLQICDAVEFAHQNLVIHRDLTPSNVLVDALGQAKLIDFGIAKPPTKETTDTSPAASIGTLSLTPGYAAPERATSNAATTLTDIFSLGRILKTLLGETADTELDAIAAKADAEDAAERYSTVQALIDDVQRYQRGEPVKAFSLRKRYRLAKFIKRNAVTVTAFSALILVLAGGLVASSIAYRQAESAKADANARFEDVRALAKFQLFDLYDQMSRVAGNTQARGDLANEAQVYLAQLASREDAPADVLLDTINGYVRLAQIMGVPSRPSLGEPDLAEQHLGTAKRLLGNYDTRDLPKNEAYFAGKAQMHAASALLGIHENMTMDLAQADIEAGQAALDKTAAPDRGPQWHAAKRALLLTQLEHADMSSQADTLYALADTFEHNAKTWPAEVLPEEDRRFDAAMALYARAIGAYVAGDHDAAVQYFEAVDKAFDAMDALEKNNPVVLYMQGWANYIGYGSAAQLEDFSTVSRFIEKSQAVTDRLRTLEERDAMVNGMNSRLQEARAQYLAASGDLQGAIRVQKEILAHYQTQMSGADKRRHVYNVSYSKISLAFLYRDGGDLGQACTELQQSWALLEPEAGTRTLPSFMARAADQLPRRIAMCQAGQDIGRETTMFEADDWGGEATNGNRSEANQPAAAP